MQKYLKNGIILLFLIINLYNSNLEYLNLQDDYCINNSKISPIDINYPYEFVKYSINFNFKDVSEAKLFIYNQTIAFNSDFGIITYNNLNYEIKKILFMSPSEHLLNGMRFSFIISKSRLRVVCSPKATWDVEE